MHFSAEALDTFSALHISEESFADFLQFLDRADNERSREHCELREHPLYRGNFTFGWEKFETQTFDVT